MRGAWTVISVGGLVASGCPTKDNPLFGQTDSRGSASDSAGSTAGTGATTANGAAGTSAATDDSSPATSSTNTGGFASTSPSGSGSSGSSTGGASPLPDDFCDADDPDLVGCWTFDELAEGILVDRSMYAHPGSADAPLLELSPFGTALRGSPNARVEVQDGGALELDQAVTIEAWIRVDSLPTGMRTGIVDNDGQYSLMLYASGGLRCGAREYVLSEQAPALGQWMYVVCAYGEGALNSIYIDGLLVNEVDSIEPMDTTNAEPMGFADTSPDFDEPFDGLIDAVRIWSDVRTSAEICATIGATEC